MLSVEHPRRVEGSEEYDNDKPHIRQERLQTILLVRRVVTKTKEMLKHSDD